MAVLPNGRICSGAQDETMRIWVDSQRHDEIVTAKAVAAQRACNDVANAITQFL